MLNAANDTTCWTWSSNSKRRGWSPFLLRRCRVRDPAAAGDRRARGTVGRAEWTSPMTI
jgi:hypothetical protein